MVLLCTKHQAFLPLPTITLIRGTPHPTPFPHPIPPQLLSVNPLDSCYGAGEEGLPPERGSVPGCSLLVYKAQYRLRGKVGHAERHAMPERRGDLCQLPPFSPQESYFCSSSSVSNQRQGGRGQTRGEERGSARPFQVYPICPRQTARQGK